MADEVFNRMDSNQVMGTSLSQYAVLEGDKEPADTAPFELYLAIQVTKINSFHGNELYSNFKISNSIGIFIIETTFIGNATAT